MCSIFFPRYVSASSTCEMGAKDGLVLATSSTPAQQVLSVYQTNLVPGTEILFMFNGEQNVGANVHPCFLIQSSESRKV